VTVLTLELHSSAFPPGKKITFDLRDEALLKHLNENPPSIKGGVKYKYANE
jgi:hypothetical protein